MSEGRVRVCARESGECVLVLVLVAQSLRKGFIYVGVSSLSGST